jgi:hypothetical protein
MITRLEEVIYSILSSQHHEMRHILVDNSTRSDPDKQYNQLWKLRMISDILNQSHAKFDKPLKHLAVHQVTVKCKETIIFRQYIPKKWKCF